MQERLVELAADDAWPRLTQQLRPPAVAAEVPGAIDQLVDAAVTRYEHSGHADPVMLVHAATAPRAAGLVLPALPPDLWIPTFGPTLARHRRTT